MSETLERIAKSGARIIGIDGAPYAGKTHLARELGELLGGAILHFDHYIPSGLAGRFPEYVNADSLKADLNNALSSNQVVVIEGTCLREILE